MRVHVYSTGRGCPSCQKTISILKVAGISAVVVDLTDDVNAPAREYVTEQLGYAQAPVVVVDDEPENHWCGFRPDLIRTLASRVSAQPVSR